MPPSPSPLAGHDQCFAKKANHENKNLKETALELGYVSSADFDKFVVPANMTRPS